MPVRAPILRLALSLSLMLTLCGLVWLAVVRSNAAAAAAPGAVAPASGETARAAQSVEHERSPAARDPAPEPRRGAGLDAWVQVFDRATGAPIAGAALARQRDGVGPSRQLTDEHGRAHLTATLNVGRPYEASYPGFAPALFTPEADHADPGHAQRIELERGARLSIVSATELGAPISHIEFRVTVPATAIARDAAAADAGTDATRFALTRAGKCSFDSLPADTELLVTAGVPDAVTGNVAQRVVLASGGETTLSWTLQSRSNVRGVLADVDGRSVAGAEIWLLPCSERDQRCNRRRLAADDAVRVVQRATTGADGRFELRDVALGTWWVGPAPHAAERPALAELCNVVPDPAGIDVELQALEERSITGRVQASDGRVVRGRVRARGIDACGEQVEQPASPDGSFALGPLAPGDYEIYAIESGTERRSGVFFVSAGQRDVVLTIGAGAAIHGRIAADGSVLANVGLWSLKGARALEQVDARAEVSQFDFLGLPGGDYAVVAWSSDGRIAAATLRDVGASETRDAGALALEPAARLRLPAGRRQPCWLWSGEQLVGAIQRRAREPEIVLVPAGPIRIEVGRFDASSSLYVQASLDRVVDVVLPE